LPQQSNQGARDRLNQSFIADACLSPRRTQNLHAVSDWSLEFGLEVERDAAVSLAETFIREHRSSLKSGRTLLIPRWARDIIYRVAVTGLSYATALNTCKQLRARSEHCIVLSETTAQLTVDQALRTLEWKAANPQGEQENNDDE